MRHKLAWTGAAAAAASGIWLGVKPFDLSHTDHSVISYLIPQARSESAPVARVDHLNKVPSRAEQLRKLADGTAQNPFDVFIIGGGATGTGCALDAVTR